MKMIYAAALLVFAALVVVQIWRSTSFSTGIEAAERQLLASQVSVPPDQAAIPELIVAFALRAGGRVGGPLAVAIRQKAEMKLGIDAAFMPLEATQTSGTRNPGFVWHAWGTMAAVIPLAVVDSYVNQTGGLEARIAGSITVASASGADVDRGEAMRFLAELPWNPDAMLNASALQWRQLDEKTVEVSLMTKGGLALVRLMFNGAGDVVGSEADDRPMSVGSSSVPTRWIGRFSDYGQVGSYRLPRHGEVAWLLPAGEFLYWRGQIVSITPAVD